MTRSDEPLFEPRIADWLEDDPYTAPDQALDVVLAAFPSIKQRRAWRVPWRVPGMTTPLRLGLTAAAVGALAIGSLLFVNRAPSGPGGVGVPTPTPVPTASPSTSPSPSDALLDTSKWPSYESARYGFSIGRPADWIERPAKRDWTVATDAADWTSAAQESFIAAAGDVRLSAWSVAVEPGMTSATWLDAYCPLNTQPCTGIDQRSIPAQIDGHAGVIVSFTDDVQAFFLVDGRMYVVACWRPDNDPSVTKYSGAIRLVQTYISTMHLLPGGPASAAPTSPGPS
jgi:hypothetical protein